MQSRAALFLAIIGAILGWMALSLQLGLTLTLVATQGGTIWDGVWRYLGYFTVVANIFAAAILTCAALRRNRYNGEFAAATAMILVGVVYSLLLRETWDPKGWQKIADVALHDAMPVIVTLFWLLQPHGHLRKGAVAASLVLPLGYCAYALVRGAFENWYPYAFLDVAHLGASAVALNCLGIGIAFLVLALLLTALDRMLARSAPVRAPLGP
ncbi:MAG TPA: Pr6Pr family membrane protein [Rhizomicrobium sp.]